MALVSVVFENALVGVSDRRDGYSVHPYSQLNLGFQNGDLASNVILNRLAFCEEIGVDLNNLCAAQQTHSTNVHICSIEDKGRGAMNWISAIPEVNALITATPGIPLLIVVADCAPVAFFDPVAQVIAVAHAGRAGCHNGIVKEVIFSMRDSLGSDPRNIHIYIGPSICTEHYIITESVANELKPIAGEELSEKGGNFHYDLRLRIQEDAKAAGVRDQNIATSEICTYETKELFSERRDGRPTGRFGMVAQLNQPLTTL